VRYITRKTKIVATLGPSSSNESVIKRLCDAGVNVFRLNFSHSNRDLHEKNISAIRHVEQEINRPLAIMMDLQGPKIRIGVFENREVLLVKGTGFILDMNNELGNTRRVSLPHPEIFGFLKTGTKLLLDDGKIALRVVNNNGARIETEVVAGGILSNKKGLNVPNMFLPIPSITEKDKKDIAFAEEKGLDFLAVSFVQTPEDVLLARSLIKDSIIKIVAKIEKPKALENLDEIIDVADAIMVARGDLGVEIPIEMVSSVQRQIIKRCGFYKRPVIVATQMLESMIDSPVPTRAEVSDVANAVYQGADAVMLSAESASGNFPVESVSAMDKIIRHTENELRITDEDNNARLFLFREANKECDSYPITAAIYDLVKLSHINYIAAFTESGRTTLDISSSRPNASIVGLTPSIHVSRQMCLAWGVHSFLIEDLYSFSQMVQLVQSVFSKTIEIEVGEKIAVVAGVPFRKLGETNIIHVCTFEKPEDHYKP
jgi:pyruvate kinase